MLCENGKTVEKCSVLRVFEQFSVVCFIFIVLFLLPVHSCTVSWNKMNERIPSQECKVVRQCLPQLFTAFPSRLSSADGQKSGILDGNIKWSGNVCHNSLRLSHPDYLVPAVRNLTSANCILDGNVKWSIPFGSKVFSWLLFQLILVMSLENEKETIHRSSWNKSSSLFIQVQENWKSNQENFLRRLAEAKF